MERATLEIRQAPLEEALVQIHVASRYGRRRRQMQRSIAAAAAVLGVAFVGTLVEQLPSELSTPRQVLGARPSPVDDASLKPLVRGALVAVADAPELKPALPAVN